MELVLDDLRLGGVGEDMARVRGAASFAVAFGSSMLSSRVMAASYSSGLMVLDRSR